VHYCKDEHELMIAMKNDLCVAIPNEPVEYTEQQKFLGNMELKLNHSSINYFLMEGIDCVRNGMS